MAKTRTRGTLVPRTHEIHLAVKPTVDTAADISISWPLGGLGFRVLYYGFVSLYSSET